ncbi:MAG TPA: gephyrin-like molybdotransferase Glp [Solirubrobacteraceae bacterium]|jgi:molybdopterin molybdotransferase|nr:gephyrin-like molybdotransferase Glp [Solirubrobacteraceae bacterium]
MSRPLIELDSARRIVLERAVSLERRDVSLEDALGMTLAVDVISSETVPGFENSAMDGFAVRAADLAGATASSPAVLRSVDESRAGRPAARSLKPGEAIAISTGAPLPEGADSVVPIEDVSEGAGEIRVGRAVEHGSHVRSAGEDIRAGEVVLSAGTGVGPFELGVLASIGRVEAPCVRRPVARVLTTGDELLDPGEPLRRGGVRNTNAYTIPALARISGATVAGTRSVGDTEDATKAAVVEALDCDVAILCGGVSVGAHDHVRPALSAAGAQQLFWGVALRPGRPTWFGTHAGGPGGRTTLVFGLPGNPVSAVVTFLLFVRPAIRVLCGAEPERDRLTVVLDESYGKQPGRAHAVRCRLELRDDGWHARTTGPQGSHVLTSMLGADALAIVPSASAGVAAGERIEVELLPRSFY